MEEETYSNDKKRMYINALDEIIGKKLRNKLISTFGEDVKLMEIIIWKYHNQYKRNEKKTRDFVERLIEGDVREMVENFDKAIQLKMDAIEKLKRIKYKLIMEKA